MKKIMCQSCGCEIQITRQVMDSGVCPICGTALDKSVISSATSTEENGSIELLRVQCMGAIALILDRVLVIYNDHIALIKNNGEVLFDESYDNVAQLKGGNIAAPNFLKLELKNGDVKKIKLDGNSIKIIKLSKTLPDYVNKLVREYMSR